MAPMKARKLKKLRTAPSTSSPSKETRPPKTPKPAPKEKQYADTQQQRQQREETESDESDSRPRADDESGDKEDATSPKISKPARKRPVAATQQQEGEAETDHSDSDDESDEESESEPEAVVAKVPKPALKKPVTVTQQQQQGAAESDHSGSDDESDEESESEREAVAAVKSEPTRASRPLVIAVTAGDKGRVTDSERITAKRAKRDVEFGDKTEDKRNMFERKWSEEDEIALLEGACEFTAKNGMSPSEDMSAFYNFIKNSLHFEVKLNQLRDKLWRLKKRFHNNLANGKKGKKKTLSTSHGQNLFDLSKEIWGSAIISGVGGGVDSKVKDKKISFNQKAKNKISAPTNADLGMDIGDEGDDKSSEMKTVEVTRRLGPKSFREMTDFVAKKGLDVVDEKEKAEIEQKWKELHVKELDLFLQQIELMGNCTNSVLSYCKGN